MAPLSALKREEVTINVNYEQSRQEALKAAHFDSVGSESDFSPCITTVWGTRHDLYKFSRSKKLKAEIITTNQALHILDLWQLHIDLNLRPIIFHELCALCTEHPEKLRGVPIITLGTYQTFLLVWDSVDILWAGYSHEKPDEKHIGWASLREPIVPKGARFASVSPFLEPMKFNPLTRIPKYATTFDPQPH